MERSARLGEQLLERTRPLVERYDVVKDVRGLGLMWAIELGEPERSGKTATACSSGCGPALFSQLVVVPLFNEHRILSQVAGHGLNVIKGLPPLVVSDEDVDWFVVGPRRDLAAAQKVPSAATSSLPAARSRV